MPLGTSEIGNRRYLETRLPEPKTIEFTAADVAAGYKDVEHGLGRTPTGYRVVSLRASSDVTIRHTETDETDNWGSVTFRLRAGAACVVKLEIY